VCADSSAPDRFLTIVSPDRRPSAPEEKPIDRLCEALFMHLFVCSDTLLPIDSAACLRDKTNNYIINKVIGIKKCDSRIEGGIL
jgi:hypothetical protein